MRTTRRCILTFDTGERVQATLTAPVEKFKYPAQLERELLEQYNRANPRKTHVVTRVHLMRN